jgi:hypothetical protein
VDAAHYLVNDVLDDFDKLPRMADHAEDPVP